MLHWILTLLISFLLIPSLYLAWRFHSHWKRRWMSYVILPLPSLILLATGFFMDLHRNYSPGEFHFMGTYILVLLTFSAVQFIFSLFCLLGNPFVKHHPKVDIFMRKSGVLICFLIVCTVIYASTKGIYKLHTTHEDVFVKDLPESFDGYRIVLFTDIHLGTYGNDTRFPQKIVNAILEERADLIAFGGDIVNYDTKELLPFISELSRLKAPDGVYAIMGNHDYQINRHWNSPLAEKTSVLKLQNFIQAMGWKLLLNSSDFIHRGDDSIAIVGVENDGRPPFPELGNLPKALKGIPDSLHGKSFFKILLSHDPTHWRRKVLPQTDIQLTLSGHTHASQFQIGSFSPSSWVYPEWGGWYQEKDRHLFVSKGLGEAFLNARIGAWPEINVITLHCKK